MIATCSDAHPLRRGRSPGPSRVAGQIGSIIRRPAECATCLDGWRRPDTGLYGFDVVRGTRVRF